MRNFKSIRDILDYVIEQEIEANHFYTKLAPKVTKQEVRAVVEKFALDEYQHKLHLEGIRDGQAEFCDDKVGDLELAHGLDEVTLHPQMSYKELLAYAIKKEDKAHRLYSQLAQIAKHASVKELFTRLAHEEAQHRLKLELEYDITFF
jgi:rubrerythrin